MVNNSGSSIAQGSLTDAEKRRKYNIERAKATHLSRQLQMRLQYARLKVEHGWQKQNLNEVENLYFHHSHQRGPKPYPSPSLMATTAQLSEAESSTVPLPTQSQLSYKLGLYSAPHTSDSPAPTSPSTSLAVLSTSASQSSISSSALSAQASNMPGMEPTPEPHDVNSLIPMPNTQRDPTEPQPNPDANINASNVQHYSQPSATQMSTPIIIMDPSPPDDPSKSEKPGRARPSRAPVNTRILPALVPEDFHGFGSAGAGPTTSTYDSFWSSHSGWTASRPFKTSSGNVLTDLSVSAGSQGPNEFVGGFESSFSLTSGAPGKIPPTVKSGGL